MIGKYERNRSVFDPWATLEAGVAAFEPGFTLEREQSPQQVRAEIAA